MTRDSERNALPRRIFSTNLRGFGIYTTVELVSCILQGDTENALPWAMGGLGVEDGGWGMGDGGDGGDGGWGMGDGGGEHRHRH
jgi:hypothetical protein